MSTEQNYSAQDTCASTSVRPVNPAAKLSQADKEQPAQVSSLYELAMKHRERDLQDAYQELHKVIKDQMFSISAGHVVDLIRSLWDSRVERIVSLKDPDEPYDPDSTVSIKRKMLDENFTVMELMAFMTNLGQAWDRVQRLEDRNQPQQEEAALDSPIRPVIESNPVSMPSVWKETVVVNKAVYESLTETLLLIKDFMVAYRSSVVIKNINDLLYGWLTKLDAELDRQPNRDQLHTTFELVHFLTELDEKVADWEYFMIHTKGKQEATNS